VESYLYPVKEGQRYINLNPGRLFVQQPPQRERDREAHLNYYASAYNRQRQLSHHKTKLNQIQQNTRINLNQQLVCDALIQHLVPSLECLRPVTLLPLHRYNYKNTECRVSISLNELRTCDLSDSMRFFCRRTSLSCMNDLAKTGQMCRRSLGCSVSSPPSIHL